MIRVLVADDHTVVRQGIRHVLEGDPEFSVVGEAGTGAEALALALRERPDVVLLDLTMPDGTGIHVLQRLRDQAPEMRVLVLSVHDEREYVIESVRAGAHGYLRKDSTPAEIRQAVRAVQAGDSYFSPVVARHLTAALRGGGGADATDGGGGAGGGPLRISRRGSAKCSWPWPAAGPTRRPRRSSGSACARWRHTATT